MNILALLLALIGAVIAAVYALESVLFFQAKGFAAPLLAKVAICGVGVYFCIRNVRRVRRKPAVVPKAEA